MNYRVIIAASLFALACETEPCGVGQVRVGTQCRATAEQDAGVHSDGGADSLRADAASSEETPNEEPSPFCGNGRPDPNEKCDDGNRESGDGCTPACATEEGFACGVNMEGVGECVPLPEPPVVQGELIAGHPDLTFTWSTASAPASFFASLDNGPETMLAPTVRQISYPNSLPGNHTFSIRSCLIERGLCGRAASFTTKVELYGTSYPRAWTGVKRVLPITALGNVTPVACDNCYDGPSGEALNPVDARATIARAISRSADLIELDVIAVNDKLYVAKEDTPDEDTLVPLSELISEPALVVSDALLALEIRETGMEPNAFAQLLLRELSNATELWGPGRPLIVRAASVRESYLTAVRAKSEPFKVHYLKTWILQPSVPAYANQGEAGIAAAGHVGIELPPSADNLFGRIRRAQAQNLAVSIGPVPGPAFYGQGVLLGLRDVVDGFSSNYRVDQARALVTHGNGAGFINASSLLSTTETANARLSRVLVNDRPATYPQPIGVAPNGAVKGTPPIQVLDASSSLAGGAFDFSGVNLGLTLWETAVPAAAKEGALLSSVLTLPAAFLSASDGASTNILGTCTSTPSGACLQLQNGTTTTVKRLELAAAVGSAWQITSYPQAGQNDPACPAGARFTGALNAERGYWIVGLRPSNGPAVLLIDGQCAAVSTATGALVPGNGKTTLGPHAARPGGLIQVGDVQLLPDTTGHGVN